MEGRNAMSGAAHSLASFLIVSHSVVHEVTAVVRARLVRGNEAPSFFSRTAQFNAGFLKSDHNFSTRIVDRNYFPPLVHLAKRPTSVVTCPIRFRRYHVKGHESITTPLVANIIFATPLRVWRRSLVDAGVPKVVAFFERPLVAATQPSPEGGLALRPGALIPVPKQGVRSRHGFRAREGSSQLALRKCLVGVAGPQVLGVPSNGSGHFAKSFGQVTRRAK
mmetsp:Transcript_12245/g.28729  ORF Transcript_12245/g.28729 Transcript_12245/m.28729 type:complete len:221 (+) Transcript_12245:2048-2710(+)